MSGWRCRRATRSATAALVSAAPASSSTPADGRPASLRLEDGALEFPGTFEQPGSTSSATGARCAGASTASASRSSCPSSASPMPMPKARPTCAGRPPTPAAMRGRALPGRLELDATLSRADGTRYTATRRWAWGPRRATTCAMRSGAATPVRRASGSVATCANSPSASRAAASSACAPAEGVELDYVPALRQADLGRPGRRWEPDRRRTADRRQLAGHPGPGPGRGPAQLRASQVEARIPDLAHSPVLQIKGASPGRRPTRWPSSTARRCWASPGMRWSRPASAARPRSSSSSTCRCITWTPRRSRAWCSSGQRHAVHARYAAAGRHAGSLRFSEQGFNVPQAHTAARRRAGVPGAWRPAGNSPVSLRSQGSAARLA